MKSFSSSSLLGIICIIAFFLFACLECNNNEQENCQNFFSKTKTWRPTPVDDSDLALKPADYFQALTGDGKYCFYWYPAYFNACPREAIILTITLEIKEDNINYLERFYGFVDISIENRIISIEDFTSTTSNGITTMTGKLTISGNEEYDQGLSTSMRLVAGIFMHTQTDAQTTHNVLNNSVKSITLDWAYNGPM